MARKKMREPPTLLHGAKKEAERNEKKPKKKMANKMPQTDCNGNTPEQILRAFKYRYIIPYDIGVDLGLSFIGKDHDAVRDIVKYKDDEMELLRHRDPVNWAKKMVAMKNYKKQKKTKRSKKCT